MGCCDCFARFFLYVFNILCLACGLAVVGVGTYLEINSTGINEDGVVIPGANAAGDVWAVSVGLFLGIGCFTVLISAIGFLAVCKKSSCLLKTYILMIGFAILLEIIAAILAAVLSAQIDSSLQKTMLDQIQNQYDNEDATSPDQGNGLSYNWNWLQSKWECCGSSDYTDYKNSYFSNTTDLPVPYECCKLGTPPSGDLWGQPQNKTVCYVEAYEPYMPGSDMYTALNPEGCYTKLKDWVSANSPLIIALGFAFGGLELLGLIFACCIKSSLEEQFQKVESTSDQLKGKSMKSISDNFNNQTYPISIETQGFRTTPISAEVYHPSLINSTQGFPG